MLAALARRTPRHIGDGEAEDEPDDAHERGPATEANAYLSPEACATCPADVNGNGAVEVSDVLLVLSEFGCDTECNPLTDFDGDTAVTVADVLFVLSAFGEGC